jgi:hypothetical protein
MFRKRNNTRSSEQEQCEEFVRRRSAARTSSRSGRARSSPTLGDTLHYVAVVVLVFRLSHSGERKEPHDVP